MISSHLCPRDFSQEKIASGGLGESVNKNGTLADISMVFTPRLIQEGGKDARTSDQYGGQVLTNATSYFLLASNQILKYAYFELVMHAVPVGIWGRGVVNAWSHKKPISLSHEKPRLAF